MGKWMKWFMLSAVLLIGAALYGCSGSDSDPAPLGKAVSLTVMHVNDTHSHMDPTASSVTLDGTKTYLDMGGFARLATKIAEIRAQVENLLVLHAGDAVQGTLYFTRYNGEADFEILNMLGIDAMAVGNHEFDKGPETLSTFFDMADFPIVSANIDASGDADLNGLIAPYTIREVDGEKIGIVGLTLPETAFISSPGDGVTFKDVVTTAARMVDRLTADGINKIIFLTHQGYDQDLALARAVDGIDLIVGGHSHTLLGDFASLGMTAEGDYPTRTVSPSGDAVYIVHSWEWAKTVGILDVAFDAEGRITQCSGNPLLMVGDSFQQKDAAGDTVPVDEATRTEIMGLIAANPNIEVVAEDADLLNTLAPYKAGVDEITGEVIGTAAQDLLHIRIPGTHTSGVEMPNGSSIAPVVCEGMVWKANQVGLNVDIALQNAGGVRIDVPAGEITVGTAYTLMPFGNTLFVLDLTGAEVKAALEEGLEMAISGASTGAFPYVGNARYTADATQPAGSRITSLEIKDSSGAWMPVDGMATYRLATNVYVAGGGDGYTTLENAQGYRYDTGFVDAEVFMDYVAHLGTVTAPAETGVTYWPDGVQETVTLKFIETTDVHGSIFPYDFIEGTETRSSLAQVFTYVESERAKAGQHVILLDNGDILQGQPITNYYNYERDTLDGHIVAGVMNYMGYDAGTVGNHDIEPGKPVYDALVQQFAFPWLAANAVDITTGQPYFEPYTVIERGGVRIAILGLITPGIPSWLPESVWPDLDFQDMIETAKTWVPVIQEQENPDLLIGLFHSGYDYTYGGRTADTPRNENAAQLVARQVPGFDLIFIGHDHMERNERVPVTGTGDTVLVLGARNAAQSVAVATVTMTKQSDGTYTAALMGENVDATAYDPDALFTSAFTAEVDAVKAYVDEEIGVFSEAVSSRDAMFGDSAFNDLIHELQFDVAEAEFGVRPEISFAAPLQFDKTIAAGPVYVRDMYKLYQYENQLFLMTLTGAEVDGHLEYSYANWANQMTGTADHLLNFNEIDEATGNYDLAARYYNYDSAAGIVYTVDVSRPAYDRVEILGMDADLDGVVDAGSVFDMNADYNVAINSYRGSGGGGHLTAGAGIPSEDLVDRKTAFTERDLRYYLTNQIRAAGTVTPRAIGNWRFIPEEWAAAGAERDYAVLYNNPDSGDH